MRSQFAKEMWQDDAATKAMSAGQAPAYSETMDQAIEKCNGQVHRRNFEILWYFTNSSASNLAVFVDVMVTSMVSNGDST